MNEDVFNMQLRKFLKKVGITSQREIEKAVRRAIAEGKIDSAEKLSFSVTLHLGDLGKDVLIEDTIVLE